MRLKEFFGGASLAAQLLSGFFVVSIDARTLDAPTLMVAEYQEAFIKNSSSLAQNSQTKWKVSEIKKYIAKTMSGADDSTHEQIAKIVLRLSKKYLFHPGLVLSVIKVESNFQPWIVSNKGATGLMQIMPETGEWIAKRMKREWGGPASLLDIETNLTFGVHYLAYLRDKYSGDARSFLLAYNQGPGAYESKVQSGRFIQLEYYNKVKEQFPLASFSFASLK